jgi:hypothetical protein
MEVTPSVSYEPVNIWRSLIPAANVSSAPGYATGIYEPSRSDGVPFLVAG